MVGTVNRRQAVKIGLPGLASASLAGADPARTNERRGRRTAFVLVHGSWHGAWCWGLVEPHLRRGGASSIAIDLPGHGLDARIPASFRDRARDRAAFEVEPSYLRDLTAADYAGAVVDAAEQARLSGAERVILVGHSMGGVPVTFAAGRSPDIADGLVYVSAVAPTPGRTGGYYTTLPAAAGQGKIGSVIVGDAGRIGALRWDPHSKDDAYRAKAKDALAADVDDRLLDAAMHLFTPDAPANIYGEEAEFAPDFARIPRAYIRCLRDFTVVLAQQDAEIADMDAAFPDNPTRVYDLDTSHEAMFAKPEELAAALLDFAG